MKTLCKKEFSSILVKHFTTNKTFFIKDKTYEFYIEDEDNDTIWVIYDENGGPSESGVRFHSEKRKEKVCAMYNFYDYFYSERAMKLKKINGK